MPGVLLGAADSIGMQARADAGGEGRRRASADRAEGRRGTADGAWPRGLTRPVPPAHPSRLLSGLNPDPYTKGPALKQN